MIQYLDEIKEIINQNYDAVKKASDHGYVVFNNTMFDGGIEAFINLVTDNTNGKKYLYIDFYVKSEKNIHRYRNRLLSHMQYFLALQRKASMVIDVTN